MQLLLCFKEYIYDLKPIGIEYIFTISDTKLDSIMF